MNLAVGNGLADDGRDCKAVPILSMLPRYNQIQTIEVRDVAETHLYGVDQFELDNFDQPAVALMLGSQRNDTEFPSIRTAKANWWWRITAASCAP